MGVSAGSGERDDEPSSDEEVPSDLESDEDDDEGSGREGGGEGEIENIEEEENQQQKRQRRKRKCPWVRQTVINFLSLDIPLLLDWCSSICVN